MGIFRSPAGPAFGHSGEKKKDTSAAKLCLCSKASLFFFQVPSSTWPGPPCNSLEVFNCQTIVIKDHDQNTSKYTHDITKTRSVDLFLELLNELDCGLCAVLLGLGPDWRHVWCQEIGKGTLPATLCHFWVILCYISRQVCKGPYNIRTSFWNTSATVISCISSQLFPHSHMQEG